MRLMNLRTPRIAGLLALALGAVALLALSGVATAKDRGGDDHGQHGHHGRHHHHGKGNKPGDDHGGKGNEPGDDNGGNSGPGSGGPIAEGEGPEAGETPSCTTAALVPGAFVGEAELRLGTGTATFEEVELGHDS